MAKQLNILVTTMGLNILNMGVIGGFVGFYSFRGFMAVTRSVSIAAFAAAWLACLVPALAGAVELYLAGTFPLRAGLIAMGLYHAVIGVIEGFVTVVAIRLIMAARPDLFTRFQVGFSLFERAWTMHGMENLLVDMIERPEFVEEFLDAPIMLMSGKGAIKITAEQKGKLRDFVLGGGLLLIAIGEGIIQPLAYASVKYYTSERYSSIGYGLIYGVMKIVNIAHGSVLYAGGLHRPLGHLANPQLLPGGHWPGPWSSEWSAWEWKGSS
jgi:hypothetical protein